MGPWLGWLLMTWLKAMTDTVISFAVFCMKVFGLKNYYCVQVVCLQFSLAPTKVYKCPQVFLGVLPPSCICFSCWNKGFYCIHHLSFVSRSSGAAGHEAALPISGCDTSASPALGSTSTQRGPLSCVGPLCELDRCMNHTYCQLCAKDPPHCIWCVFEIYKPMKVLYVPNYVSLKVVSRAAL